MFAGATLRELSVTIGLQAADLGPVILGCGRVFHEISESPVAVSAQGFCQDQPSLGLGEDTCVLFDALVVNDSESAVKSVGMIGRGHQQSAVGSV